MRKPTYEELATALEEAIARIDGETYDASTDLMAIRDAAKQDGFVPQEKFVPTIALDFDGVVHAYLRPFTTPEEIHDDPVEGAFEFIDAALREGFDVVLHTARAGSLVSIAAIRAWFTRHGRHSLGQELRITAQKVGAIVYIDDRGFRFEGQWPDLEFLRGLRQWNKPKIPTEV